jgi:hypothetical protein
MIFGRKYSPDIFDESGFLEFLGTESRPAQRPLT